MRRRRQFPAVTRFLLAECHKRRWTSEGYALYEEGFPFYSWFDKEAEGLASTNGMWMPVALSLSLDGCDPRDLP